MAICILGLVAYALIATGLFLCALTAASCERQNRIIEGTALQKQINYFVEIAKKSANKQGRLAMKIIEQQRVIIKLEGDKKVLAQQYIKVSNQYAWHRMSQEKE